MASACNSDMFDRFEINIWVLKITRRSVSISRFDPCNNNTETCINAVSKLENTDVNKPYNMIFLF